MAYPAFNTLAPGYARLWADLVPRRERADALNAICAQLVQRKATYADIAQTVWGSADPWFVIAIIDQMEHDPELGLCNSHLHNGDPLTARTVNVPAGRPPKPAKAPFSFADSAIDALHYEGFDQVTVWTVERLAYWLERYNGGGYLDKPIENPYLASWSNLYTAGKFTSDHHYDADAVSQQPGALTVLKVLTALDPTVSAVLAPAPPTEPATPVAIPAAPTSTAAPAATPKGKTMGDSLKEIEDALTAADSFLPSILGTIGAFFPPAAALAKFLPLLRVAIQAVRVVQQATGATPQQAATMVVAHLTPGESNTSALS